ncbi:MAG: OmpA family protein [Pseudohongiella sp.]|nr:OmpA family protein [Pseudohongiella sp.]
MRISATLASMLALSVGLNSQSILADAGQFYLAPGAQWLELDSVDLDNDSGLFFGLGYDFTDRLSAELSTFDLETATPTGVNIDLDHYKLDLLYDLNRRIGALNTFVVSGFGNTDFQGENDTLWDLGVGFEVKLSANLSWRTAVRTFNYLGRDHEDSDAGVDSALVYRFGGGGSTRSSASRQSQSQSQSQPQPRNEVVATPADADRDGVPDSRDNCPETPRSYAVDADGCPIPVEEVARVELLVNFDFDRSQVKPEYFSEIEEVANFMQQHPDIIVELEGHTDSRGTEEYNRGLADRRVSAVRQVLIDRFRIQASRVSTIGIGESQPVASNDTEAGRAQNRRVITVIIKTLQNYKPR